MRRSIDELEGRLRLERARDRTGDDLDRTRVRLAPLTGQRAEARQASQRFRAALVEVYRDPAAARRAFHARAERVGGPAAARELKQHPERFGSLRGTQVGPVRSAERTAALRAVPKLEHLGRQHYGRVRDAWVNRAEYRQARATVRGLERQVKTLHELQSGPGRAQLEQRLAREVRKLEPRQRRGLRPSLPVPHRRLLRAAIMAGRAFARDQGHER